MSRETSPSSLFILVVITKSSCKVVPMVQSANDDVLWPSSLQFLAPLHITVHPTTIPSIQPTKTMHYKKHTRRHINTTRFLFPRSYELSVETFQWENTFTRIFLASCGQNNTMLISFSDGKSSDILSLQWKQTWQTVMSPSRLQLVF